MPMQTMKEIRNYPDDTPLIGNPDALREKADQAGFLFFKQLIPKQDLFNLRTRMSEVLSRYGILKDGVDPFLALCKTGTFLTENDDEYKPIHAALQKVREFHAMAHHENLIRVLRNLFGSEVLVHPRNINRNIFPCKPKFTTPPHQDYCHIKGTPNTWTSWIPIGDCPRQLGSLSLVGGSHKRGLLPIHSAYGAGGAGVDVDEDAVWYNGDFECGDVLLFHSLTVHQGTDNQSRDQVRMSLDYRFQSVNEPVHPSSINVPHLGLMSWDDVYENWGDKDDLKYYWKKFDLTVTSEIDPSVKN